MRVSVVLLLFTLVASILGSPRAMAQDEPQPSADPGHPQRLSESLPQLTSGPTVSLAEAMTLADRRNLSLQAARTEIHQAQAALKSAWARLHPRAYGTMTFNHRDHADMMEINTEFGVEEAVGRHQQDFRGNLQVDVPLVDAPSWWGVSMAHLDAEVASLRVQMTRQDLLLLVAETYFQALSFGSLIDVQRTQMRAAEHHFAVASMRHRSGTGSRLDVVRAQTELVQAREELLSAHTAFDSTRDTLAVLTGTTGLPMPAPIEALPLPAVDQQELIDRSIREREDLQLKRAIVRLADRQLDATWMSFVPRLSASWQYSQQMSKRGLTDSDDKSRWLIGLTLSVPIYDYTRYGKLDQMRVSLRRVELEAQDAELQARLQVREAHRKWLEAMSLVDTAQQRAALAQESLQLSEAAYENGTGNSLAVTDARRTSRQTAINLATKRFDTQLALLRLLRHGGADMSETWE